MIVVPGEECLRDLDVARDFEVALDLEVARVRCVVAGDTSLTVLRSSMTVSGDESRRDRER